MKKSLHSRIIEASALMALLLALIPCELHAEASDDPNQLLAFKKLRIDPIQDNVDGAFQAPIKQSYKEIFDHNPRFEIVDGQAAADAVIRTKITKQTSGLDLDIDLLVKDTQEVFSSERAHIQSNASGNETGQAVKQLLKTMLKRIPFYGSITGRDGNSITLDIGMSQGLKNGDIVQISRVDGIKRHPLLKSIVDVQLVPVGSIVVDNVEGEMAFGHVLNETSGERIQRLYKVTAIEQRASEQKLEHRPESRRSLRIAQNENESNIDEDRPMLGYVDLGISLGEFSSSTSRSVENATITGSSFSPGFKLAGELWLTKRWFADLAFAYSAFSYRQSHSNAAVDPASAESNSSTHSFDINAGYKYLADGSIYGPQLYFKMGYSSFSWNVPTNASLLQGEKSYSGLNLGIGGLLPIVDINQGLMLNANFLLFPSLTEGTFKTGGNPSATVASFYFGGYYYLTSRVSLKAGVSFETYSADFDNGASSTNQKAINFLPSLQYYF